MGYRVAGYGGIGCIATRNASRWAQLDIILALIHHLLVDRNRWASFEWPACHYSFFQRKVQYLYTFFTRGLLTHIRALIRPYYKKQIRPLLSNISDQRRCRKWPNKYSLNNSDDDDGRALTHSFFHSPNKTWWASIMLHATHHVAPGTVGPYQ